MTRSRAVALVSHGRGSGGTSIATPGTSCTWATNWEGQPSVAACGSAQDHGEDDDAGGRESHDERSLGRWYPVQNYTTRWRCTSHRQGTPSARIWINMLRGRDGALSGCLGGAQDGVPPG